LKFIKHWQYTYGYVKETEERDDKRMTVVEHVDLWLAECGNAGEYVGVFFELVDGWVD
jgi:hypothetical protein